MLDHPSYLILVCMHLYPPFRETDFGTTVCKYFYSRLNRNLYLLFKNLHLDILAIVKCLPQRWNYK